MLEGMEHRFSKTPIEKIITPEPELAVPIIQALVYSGENDDLREMYLNLLATAMDTDKEKKAHRAYVQIINQLSPLEAKLIAEFRPKTENYMYMSKQVTKTMDLNGNIISTNESEFEKPSTPSYYKFPETIKPMVSYWLTNENIGAEQQKPTFTPNAAKRILIQDNIIKTNVIADIDLISAGVTNLLRLGLIETNYLMNISESMYEQFYKHPLYLDWMDFIENKENKVICRCIRSNTVTPDQFKQIIIQKGIARLTQFGYNFISASVIQNEIETDS